MKTMEPSGGGTIYTLFPNYEEELRGTATIQRSTYTIAGQAVAIRVSGDPKPANNGLFFFYADHLGSATVLNKSGTKVVGSETYYAPFGGYRNAPTSNPAISDRGYTGHRHNNDLGLIYMNARYYVPAIGRFASADTIVPNPAEPQSFNRYSYVGNRPLTHTDPSGHCQGTYDPSTGQATEDQTCWDFLYNEFCGGGSIAICKQWYERLFASFTECFGQSCLISFGSYFWTETELRTLRDAIADAITVLTDAGYDGTAMLVGISFERSHTLSYSITLPKNMITLDQVDAPTIWHEIAHTISFRNSRTPQNEYYSFAEGFASTPWYTLEDFCYRSYCKTEYVWWKRPYTGNHPEYWADAFSAWAGWKTSGALPVVQGRYSPQWNAISRGVEWSLTVTLND